ncbi:MAG: molecular chaperone TorD family protein [Rhodospirillales bacterium]
MATISHGTQPIAEEDQLRAQFYALLAALLARPADAEMLARLAGIEGDDTPIGKGLRTLSEVARATTPDAVEQEYNNLFIGIGKGELTPFGSYYLTGFLNEKPLARLRSAMDRHGITRADEVSEPEDHIASVCEMMSGLITGAFGSSLDLVEQREFYREHIGPWAGRFFADLEAARAAAFYMPVGAIGRLFMEIEAEAFEMTA